MLYCTLLTANLIEMTKKSRMARMKNVSLQFFNRLVIATQKTFVGAGPSRKNRKQGK